MVSSRRKGYKGEMIPLGVLQKASEQRAKM